MCQLSSQSEKSTFSLPLPFVFFFLWIGWGLSTTGREIAFPGVHWFTCWCHLETLFQIHLEMGISQVPVTQSSWHRKSTMAVFLCTNGCLFQWPQQASLSHRIRKHQSQEAPACWCGPWGRARHRRGRLPDPSYFLWALEQISASLHLLAPTHGTHPRSCQSWALPLDDLLNPSCRRRDLVVSMPMKPVVIESCLGWMLWSLPVTSLPCAPGPVGDRGTA